MKWFQHDTNASSDAKIKKLILRHGAEGYAVYFHCLELIASDITQTNITFELEHDCEIIADNLKINGDNNIAGIDKVNNIMTTIINLGLFQETEEKVVCYKLAKRLDNTVSRSPEINKIKEQIETIDRTKQLRSCNVPEYNRLEYIRSDQNKVDQSKVEPEIEIDPDFIKFWDIFQKKVDKPKTLKRWGKLSKEDKDNIFEHVYKYVKSTPDPQFRKNPLTYLNNESWNNEIISSQKPKIEALSEIKAASDDDPFFTNAPPPQPPASDDDPFFK